MDNIHIHQLTNTSITDIHQAFAKAFADYVEDFELSADELKYMLERRGCDLNLSFGAFHQDELVAFILNGTGTWNGQQTAYDTGTGTIKTFRKKGIATRIFNESLPVLRENGIGQYLLEVIKTNTGAYDLYRKAGFQVSQEYDYYVSPKSTFEFPGEKINEEYSLINIEEPDWELLKKFWDFEPSWQNSINSVQRKQDYFSILGIRLKNELVGYGIIERHTGDIPQLAIHPAHRRKGFASVLLKNLFALASSEEIKFINCACDNKPFQQFAKKIGLVPGFGQYEMVMDLG